MKKKVTSEYGITLVSLVITVVVMVLLAGVIINLNDSNEGVLDIANQKKEETEILSIKEEIKTFLAENPPDNYESLIETLKNYGTIQDENDPENATLITNNGNYLIPVKDIWNVNASFSALEIGDYVSYKPQNASYLVSKDYSGNTSNVTVSLSNTDNIIWRVLDIDYNNGEIKLVPSSSLGLNLSVGGVNGYNNIVKLSNDLCDTLFSNEEKSVKARNLNLEDIEKIASNIEDLKGSSYGTEKDYTATRYKYPSIFASFVREIMQNLAIDSDLAFLYCEKEFLNVAQMADLAKTDQATFSRKFKQVFGLSPKIWLDERRFEKARFLLEYSNKNINEICAECGFNSPSWFIERFKSRYHCTPKRYQKSKNLHY